MGEVVVRFGDVWWAETPEAGGRPALILTRDEAIPVLRKVVVAPVTRNVRHAVSQLSLGRAEGLRHDSVANFDDVTTVWKSLLVRRLGSLGERHHELCATLRAMSGC